MTGTDRLTPPPRAVLEGGEGVWHKVSVSDCLPLAAPIGPSPLLILTLCGPERVLVVSTEPPDDLSCLTTPGVGRPGDGAVARALDVLEGGGGGGWDPKVCGPEMARSDFPDRKSVHFVFSRDGHFGLGGGGGSRGGGTPPGPSGPFGKK